MRNVRTKKIKLETVTTTTGPFDDSLIQIQLDKNEKCIQEINRDQFERAAEFLRQIKADGEMISPNNRERAVIKCLSLNTEAYFHQKQKQYQEALRCLSQAECIETSQNSSPIDLARTKLNKSVVLSHLGNHDESIKLATEALDLLKNKKDVGIFELRKNQYKLYQIMIISFYNIASQLSHLSEERQASRVYKEGYYLAQKTLGPNHKLTTLLKSIIKTNKNNSRSKLQLSEIKSNKSLIRQYNLQTVQFLPKNNKEKELTKIYAPKRKSGSEPRKHKESKRDLVYYLKSLQKIKNLYRRRNPDTFLDDGQQSKQKGRINKKQSSKFYTEASTSNRYESEHQNIKHIILNGKTVNRNHLIPVISQSQSSAKNIKPYISTNSKIQPLPKIDNTDNKIEEKKEEKEACQLI